jgi:hypothetical protein
MPTSDENRCGQFTFYFSKCGHATSHNFHRAPDSGSDCNSNCIYDRKIDYWFWAGKDKRCSFCGLGQEQGFGTQHPIPEDEGLRLILFEKVKEGMILSEPDDVYNAKFDEAAEWYNRNAMEAIALADERAKAQNPSPGKLRTQRRLRHENRREIERLRAKRRMERWVQNVRDEQYTAVKGNMEVGKQPFIMGDIGNPYMDLYSEASLTSLANPIDNCALCQYPLDDVRECGNPYSLPCGHMFHLRCLEELFDRRAAGEEKEIHKCPLCKIWFRDLREVPDFYGRFRSHNQDFDSNASSSELSDSDAGAPTGDVPPPWIFRPEAPYIVPELLQCNTCTRSDARLREIVHDSTVARNIAETEPGRLSSSPPSRRPGTRALLNHIKSVEASGDSEVEESHLPSRQEPEVLEISSGLPPPSSTATVNGSLQGAVNSNTADSAPTAPIADSARTQKRKRKSRKAKNEGDEPNTRSQKRRRKR